WWRGLADRRTCWCPPSTSGIHRWLHRVAHRATPKTSVSSGWWVVSSRQTHTSNSCSLFSSGHQERGNHVTLPDVAQVWYRPAETCFTCLLPNCVSTCEKKT